MTTNIRSSKNTLGTQTLVSCVYDILILRFNDIYLKDLATMAADSVMSL